MQENNVEVNRRKLNESEVMHFTVTEVQQQFEVMWRRDPDINVEP